ncbi:CorA metal ion transporter [Coemansia javaensis]|uniref:CorA metal ion transporter n=1 Tax=Coemansia javaensis TaxID=2761396 RepID=A0A9W8HEY0_9FUNG|nr:CorA metal ion transporter [Coemansia javaensis]
MAMVRPGQQRQRLARARPGVARRWAVVLARAAGGDHGRAAPEEDPAARRPAGGSQDPGLQPLPTAAILGSSDPAGADNGVASRAKTPTALDHEHGRDTCSSHAWDPLPPSPAGGGCWGPAGGGGGLGMWSPPSVGVRSSLLDAGWWQLEQQQQQQQQQQRCSRVRSIAATGRDSRCYCGSNMQPPATPAHSTDGSSVGCDSPGEIKTGSAVRYSSAALRVPACGMAPDGRGLSAATVLEPPDGAARDSSVLWMHMVVGDSVYSAGGGKAGPRGTGRFMLYSGQAGAAYASSLHEAVCGGVGLEALARQAQSGPGGTKSPGAASTSTQMPAFWMDAAGATARELHKLGEMFGLHPLTVEDIELGCGRDKIDAFGDYVFVVYHAVARPRHGRSRAAKASPAQCWDDGDDGDDDDDDGDGSDGRGGRMCVVVKHGAVLTFHNGGQRAAVGRVVQRLTAISEAAAGSEPGSLLDRLADYPAYVAYALLDDAADQLGPEIAEIEQQVNAIDEAVLALPHAEHEGVLRRMGEQRRRILRAWRLAQPKAEVVAALAKLLGGAGRGGGWAWQRSAVSLLADSALAGEVVRYLGDVHEHLAAAADACSRAEAVLARSHANHLARISLELSRATFDSSATTERWTMLGAIVVPINVVTSLLGVNLKVPGQDRDDTLNFFVVVGCMVVYAGATLAFWRWRRIS